MRSRPCARALAGRARAHPGLADALRGCARARGHAGAVCAPTLNPPLWELGHVGWFQEWWIARNRERGLGVRVRPGARARRRRCCAGADCLVRLQPRAAPQPLGAAAAGRGMPRRGYLAGTLAQTLDAAGRSCRRDAGDDALYFFRLVALHEEMHAEAGVLHGARLGVPLSARMPTASARAPPPAEMRSACAGIPAGLRRAGLRLRQRAGRRTQCALATFEIDAAAGDLGALPAFRRGRRLRGAALVEPTRRLGLAAQPAGPRRDRD